MSCEGFCGWQVQKKDGTVTAASKGDQNLVLDSFYTFYMDASQGWEVPSIKLGTGTTPPSAGQTDLVATGMTLTGLVESYPVPTVAAGIISANCVLSKDSGIGGATGTWTELGLSWTTGVQTRLLFKDSGGNPTAITVLSDEKLVITYTLIWKMTLIDVTTTQTLAGQSRTVIVRHASLGDLPLLLRGKVNHSNRIIRGGTVGQFGAAGERDSRAVGGAGEAVLALPDASMITTLTRPTSADNGDITGFIDGLVSAIAASPRMDSYVRFKYWISPPIVKTPDDTLTLRYQITRSRM